MDYPANLSHKSFRFCGIPFWILSRGRNSPGTKVFPPEKRLYAPRRGSHTLAKKIGSADTASPSLFAVAEILDRRWIIPPICPTKASAFAGSRFGSCPGEETPPGPRFFLRKNACTRQGAARIRSQRKLARQILLLRHSLRYPKFWIAEGLSRQFSLTFTQVWRYTFVPMNRSISWRARVDTFFSMEPPLPMMMPLWLFFSQ